MILEKIDKIIFSRGKWIIYIVGTGYIIYNGNWNIEIIYRNILSILVISIIFLIIILLHQNYKKWKIEEINKWLFEKEGKYWIIFKIRHDFINISLYLQVILSIIIIPLDRWLRRILFLNDVKFIEAKIWLYIRYFIYYNILLWIVLPFKLIGKYYKNILLLIEIFEENLITIKQYIKARIEYIIISIICVLLLNVARIDIIIVIWIIDEILNIYISWYKTYKKYIKNQKEKINKETLIWGNKIIALAISYENLKSDYSYLMLELVSISNKRWSLVINYKGLNVEEIKKVRFNLWIFVIHMRYWKEIYLPYEMAKTYLEYYLRSSDQMFFLRIISDIILNIRCEFVILERLRFIEEEDLKIKEEEQYYNLIKDLSFEDFLNMIKDETGINLMQNMNEYKRIYVMIVWVILFLQSEYKIFELSYKIYEENADQMIFCEEEKEVKQLLISLKEFIEKL